MYPYLKSCGYCLRSGKSTFAKALKDELSHQGFVSVDIIRFDDYIEDRATWDDKSYRRGREKALRMLTERINSFELSGGVLSSASISTSADPGSVSLGHAIIVDDLNYLRSMRREIYVIGRDRYWATIVLWINTPLKVALERNNMRCQEEIIDESSICKVAEDFEEPEQSRFIFEKLWYMVDGCTLTRYSVQLESVPMSVLIIAM